jgi:hypothetical protein
MSERKRMFGVAGGAVGLSGLAAALGTCCVAPWAVTVLGVSGAITLARLARIQPYLLIVAAVLLALAFYWAYRPQPACADGTCAPTQRQRQRWVVWTAALAFAALAWLSLFPTY